MRTANPTLGDSTFTGHVQTAGQPMTITGTVNKTALLLLLAMVPAIYVWHLTLANPAGAMRWVMTGAIGGAIVALLTCWKKEWSPVSAPIYAVCEGLLLGGISALYEMRFSGIVLQAAMLTFGTLFALLAAYRSGLIRATENFKLGVVAATGGIAVVYLLSFVLGLFGVQMPFIHESGPLGIGISVVIVVIAALNLVLDFDFIENGASLGAPKYLEWYAAFGLLVTLVWLYLEILRLLSKLSSRRN